MEMTRKQDTAAAVATATVTASSCMPWVKKKKKNYSILRHLRAAILMLRRPGRRSSGKKRPAAVHPDATNPPSKASSDGMLKPLVVDGRMRRPLQLRLEYRPPFPLLPPTPPPAWHGPLHCTFLPPPSPAWSCYSDYSTRCHASAEDLQFLNTSDDDGDSEAACDGKSGVPNAIDVMAEEFIARFNQQMRLPRVDSFDGKYNQ